MTVALIGLIGIAVGAVLGGLIQLWVEARKRHRAAHTAGLLIGAELDVITGRLESAKPNGGRWWSGNLPSEAWKAHRSELAADVDPQLLAKLSKIYTNVDRWDVNREQPDKPPAVDELDKDIAWFKSVRNELGNYASRLYSPVLVATRRSVSLLAVTAALLVGAWFTFTPRPNVTATTVASALQAHLGSSELVGCEPASNRWACTDYHLSESRNACLASATALSSDLPVSLDSINFKNNATSCGESMPPTLYAVELVGANQIYSPAQIEQAGNRPTVYVEPIAKKSIFDRFIDYFIRGK